MIYDLDKLTGSKTDFKINNVCIKFILDRVDKNTKVYECALNFKNNSYVTNKMIKDILYCYMNVNKFYIYVLIKLYAVDNFDLHYKFLKFNERTSSKDTEIISELCNKIDTLNININTIDFIKSVRIYLYVRIKYKKR